MKTNVTLKQTGFKTLWIWLKEDFPLLVKAGKPIEPRGMITGFPAFRPLGA
jgi:hypothetical protein